MNKKGRTIGCLVWVVLFLFCAAAQAQMTGGDYEISFSDLGTGGGEMTGGDYSMDVTAGQTGSGDMQGGEYWSGGGALYHESEGTINSNIRARSSSGSCPTCSPALTPGYPNYDPVLHRYWDYITIENQSASALSLPVRAELTSLTAGVTAIVPPAEGTGLAGDTRWTYSTTDPHTPGVVGTTFPAGDRISKVWGFDDPLEITFDFWVDCYLGGTKGKAWAGRLELQAGSPTEGAEVQETQDIFYVDDGTTEIHAGSDTGKVVLANRFATVSKITLSKISFYTSGAAAGDAAEVIIYEDPSGLASVPEPSMEVWRTAVVLGGGGFQEVAAGGCPALNAGEVPGAAFFVAVVNTAARNYTIGIDLSGAGHSYVSVDGGQSYKSLSTKPIIDGHAMIRAHTGQASTCFVGVALGR